MNHRHGCIVILGALAASACGDFRHLPTAPIAAGATLSRAPVSPTYVTTTLYDSDGAGTPLFTRSDDYNGTGAATYTSVNGVASQINSAGSWQLLLANQTTRRVYLVLSSQGIPVPDGYYSASVEVFSKCFDQNNVQVSLTTIPAGGSNGNCSFGVDFSVDRTKYKLAMSPVYAGTGRALVTCKAASASGCIDWTIVPNNTVSNAGVANLYHYANNGGLLLDGVYKDSYSVHVAP